MGWWGWALVGPDGVALSRMVGVSASVNLPLHHGVQEFSSGTGSPGWSRKKGRKAVVVCIYLLSLLSYGKLFVESRQFQRTLPALKVARWCNGKAFEFAISRSQVQILLEATLRNNCRQVVYTYVPLSPSSITWYWPKGGDALRLGR